MNKRDRRQLLAAVAEMYYMDGRSQAEIARKTGYSRSAISRLLTEARQAGVVEIRINHPLQRARKLETFLTSAFALRDAFVVSRGNLDYGHVLRLLGRLGANYINEHLPAEGVFGISWGTAVREVANAMSPRFLPNLKVVQMIGSIGYGDPLIDGPEVAQSFAKILGTQYHTLNAPLMVQDEQTQKILEAEPSIRETLALASQAHIVLVGIGSTRPERSSLVRAGYLSNAEAEAVAEAGAVGDICARHYDIYGRTLDIPLDKRIMGIELSTFVKRDSIKVGVAGGRVKAPAILGALRGGFVDVLVTDSSAAEQVIRMHEFERLTA